MTETIVDQDQQSAIIDRAISDYMKDHRTMIPAKVKSVNLDKNTVDVKILVKELLGDNFEKIDTLKELPILAYGNKKVYITVPVEAGDEGIVLFMDRSIDDWENGFKDHYDNRVMDLSDGVFLPMQLRYKDNLVKKYNKESLVIRAKCCNDMRIVVDPKEKEITAGFVKEKNTLKMKKDSFIAYTNDEKTKIELEKEAMKISINDDLKVEIKDDKVIVKEEATFEKEVLFKKKATFIEGLKAVGDVEMVGNLKVLGSTTLLATTINGINQTGS